MCACCALSITPATRTCGELSTTLAGADTAAAAFPLRHGAEGFSCMKRISGRGARQHRAHDVLACVARGRAIPAIVVSDYYDRLHVRRRTDAAIAPAVAVDIAGSGSNARLI